MIVLSIILTILCIILLGLGIYALDLSRSCRRIKDELSQTKAKRDKFEDLATFYEEENKDLQEKLLQKENDIGFAQGQQVQGELQVRDVAAELNNLKEQKMSVESQLQETTARLTGTAMMLHQYLLALANSKEEQLQTESKIHDLEKLGREMSVALTSIESDLKIRGAELRKMLNISMTIDYNKEYVVWEPVLTEKQGKLVGILRDLSNMYPDLSVDFANIEWKKIWMPQLQQLTSIIDTRGIYRLVLKDGLAAPIRITRDGQEEELPVCYVGQAVNIKDRWYQHVKKMIGVMPTGNEKVYDWRPEDFKWCIIEKGKDVDLDYSEKYWIQYYCAKDGLNKKL